MRKRVKNIIGLLSVMVLFNTMNVYATPDVLPKYEGEYSVENNTETQYSMFSVPSDVYSYIYDSQNLGTMVLTDDKGEEVPYFIVDKYEGETAVKDSFETALVYGDYALVNPSYVYRVYQKGDATLNYNKIKVNANKDSFSKTVRVYGSYDNINFTPISTQNIYVIESEKANNICFDTPVDYDFIKIQVMTDEEGFELTDVEVSSDILYTNGDFYNKEIEVGFSQVDDMENKKSNIYLGEEIRDREVIKLRLEVEDERFSREAILYYPYDDTKYNMTLAKTSSDMPEIYGNDLDLLDCIIIKNYDDKPLKITGVYATIVDNYVVFDNRDHENVKLNFDSYTTEPRKYDLGVTIADNELDGNVKVVNTSYERLDTVIEHGSNGYTLGDVDERLVLNIVLVLVVLVIAVLGFVNLKKRS